MEYDTEFNRKQCVRKYCQLFTHESNAFLSVITPIESSACADAENEGTMPETAPSP